MMAEVDESLKIGVVEMMVALVALLEAMDK